MDFKLTPSQQMTRQTVREFVRKEVVPLASELDESAEFPRTLYKQALGLEVLELTVPEALGGIGGDFLSLVLALEEFACGSAALAHCIAATEAVVHLLARYGSKQQQRQYLPRLLAGELIGATGIWRPDAEISGAAALSAAAEADGLRLNGSLPYAPAVSAADLVVAFAAVEGGGIRAFLLQPNMPGLQALEAAALMGIRGFSLGRLQFDDAHIPADHLLGEKESGPQIADALLKRTEAATGAIAVGLSQAALEAAVRHSKGRVQFGKPLFQMEATQNKIADMAAGIESARLLVYDAAFFLEAGKAPGRLTAMAKLVASELAVGVCREAVQIHGGYGYVKDYPVERFYRDSLFSQLYPAANETQRFAIARHVVRRIR